MASCVDRGTVPSSALCPRRGPVLGHGIPSLLQSGDLHRPQLFRIGYLCMHAYINTYKSVNKIGHRWGESCQRCFAGIQDTVLKQRPIYQNVNALMRLHVSKVSIPSRDCLRAWKRRVWCSFSCCDDIPRRCLCPDASPCGAVRRRRLQPQLAPTGRVGGSRDCHGSSTARPLFICG